MIAGSRRRLCLSRPKDGFAWISTAWLGSESANDRNMIYVMFSCSGRSLMVLVRPFI